MLSCIKPPYLKSDLSNPLPTKIVERLLLILKIYCDRYREGRKNTGNKQQQQQQQQIMKNMRKEVTKKEYYHNTIR